MNVALIKQWIKAHGPNGMERLAANAGLSFATLQKVVGERGGVSLDTAKKIAEALGVNLDELCGDSKSTPKDAA